MLCDVCLAIFHQPVNPSQIEITGDHHGSPQDLYKSAAADCQICALAGSVWAPETGAHLPWRTKYTLTPRPSTDLSLKHPPELYIFRYGREALSDLVGFTLEPMDGFEETVKTCYSARNTLCVSSWKLWKDWLDNCLQNHSRCNLQMQSAWVPTRLIYLRPQGKIVQPQLRIFENHTSPVPYVTLSHCWGAASIKKLEKANLKNMCTGFDLDWLPKSFKDAVFVAQALGFQYIWIDCLCIIQDSKGDWSHEAVLMGEIYKNSRLNIAATGAVDSNGGCFFTRNSALIRPSRVKLDWVSEEGLSSRSYYLVDEYPSLKGRFENSRLNHRAWILQERLLAPRVLHFGEAQLFWECRELEACESYPNGLPKHQGRSTPFVKSALFELESDNTKSARSRELYSLDDPTPFQHWATIVETYSRSRLTFAGDRLIALFGIASEMKRVLKDDYLAGLWRKSLLYELLWKAQGASSRPESYRAPSWSWLSLEGAVSYSSCLEPLWAERVYNGVSLIDAQVEYDLTDPSQINGGFVTVQGKLCLITWGREWSSTDNSTTTHLSGIREWDGESEVDPLNSQPENYQSSYINFDDYNESSPPPQSLFCLPIVDIGTTVQYDWVEHVEGLLLTRDREGTFRRVGHFFVLDANAGDAFRALSSGYTITIV